MVCRKKNKTYNEWIWDDDLGPATRPMVHCYSAVSNSREAESAPVSAPVIREAESANKHCNYGEIC